MLEPRNKDEDDGLILEFKVCDKADEETLEDTVAAALRQIKDKKYALLADLSLLNNRLFVSVLRSFG